MNKNQIIKTVWEMTEPITEELGLTLWDVLFLKEGATWSLRIIIDRAEGVDMDDCTNVSRALDPKLDEVDPIDQSYVLEVWSAGYDRDLVRDFHFTSSIGMKVTVGLFQADENGEKEPVLTLKEYSGKTIVCTDDQGNDRTYTLSELKFVRRKDEIDFSRDYGPRE